MKKISSIFLLLLPVMVMAQDKKEERFFQRTSLEGGITLTTNGGMTAVGLGITQYWGLGKGQRKFKIGLGPRLTSAFGSKKLLYITAPAILTSGKEDPSVFFADQITENIDTLRLQGTQVNSLNIMLALRYDFYKKWGIEVNIDLIGFSFGGTKSGVLEFGDGFSGTQNVDAKPHFGNILFISDNDIGSLNSEFLITYQFNEKFRFKAGAAFLFNEYKIDPHVTYYNTKGTLINTDAYRTKQLMYGVGVNYTIR